MTHNTSTQPFTSRLSRWFGGRADRPRRGASPRRARRPLIEALDDRTLLTTLPVTSLLDDGGAGTLRSVIAGSQPGDVIDLTGLSGTIALTQSYTPIEIAHDLTINGPGAAALTIDGQDSTQIFKNNFGATSSISGLTITRGYDGSYGGAIVNYGTLTITNSVISDSSSGYAGGGIANAYPATLTLNNSTVSGNSAYNGSGLYNGTEATMIVSNSRVTNNSYSDPSSSNYGGGICNYAGMLTITNSVISDNQGYLGGGIANIYGTLNLIESTVSGNTSAYEGGGIYTNYIANISNSTISHNTSYDEGGGISSDGDLTVIGTTIAYNVSEASQGGGVVVTAKSFIANSTIAYNTSAIWGSGLSSYYGATVVNSTIAHNSNSTDAANGAGVFFYSYANSTLNNTIVAGNESADVLLYNFVGQSPTLFGENNLLGTALVSVTTDGPVTDNLTGTIVADPLLGPLQDNGGPTETFALGAGSPALNAGLNSLAADPNTDAPLDYDQRGAGFARIFGGTVDIGAFEYQPTVAATTTAVTASANPSVFGQSVTFTATVKVSSVAVTSGTVTFMDGTTVLASNVPVNAAGLATFSISTLSVGSHTITAIYSGAAGLAGSSATVAQTVRGVGQQITVIGSMVDALVASNVLDTGNGNALTSKLAAATASLDRGNASAAAAQLKSFINQVNALLKSRRLSAAQAQALIDAAQLAINAIENGGA